MGFEYKREIVVGDIVEFWDLTKEHFNYHIPLVPVKTGTYFIFKDLKKIRYNLWSNKYQFFGYEAIAMKTCYPSEPEGSKVTLWIPKGLRLPTEFARHYYWKKVSTETS